MLDGKIAQANGRLKSANVRARIEQIGNRLYLQATLPPKPDSKATRNSQQRIALGISASPAGLSLAEKEARKVSALLDCRQFDWHPYLSQKQQPPTTVSDWLTRFEYEIKPTVAEITWQTDYWEVLKRLPQNEPLTLDLLLAVIDGTKANSRTRKRFCNTLGRFARFAGIDADFSGLQGNYSATQVDPRSLPSDEQIVSFWQQMSNPAWRWVYGMLATFGLRNHEVFFLDLEGLLAGNDFVRVTEGKTKGRMVWAYYPEWIDHFSLRNPKLPNVTGEIHSDYGDRVTGYLRGKLNMPFQPYDLRHCWAVRTMLFGLPDSEAARQMGHSLTVHTQTYHRWITARTQQQIHENLKNRSDRPLAPQILS